MTAFHPAEAAVAEILRMGIPVLIPDACALLDLVRAPAWERFSEEDGRAAVGLLAMAETGELAVAVPQQALAEYEANLSSVRERTSADLGKMAEAVGRTFARMRSIGEPLVPDAPDLSRFAEAGLPLAERMIARAVTFVAGDEEERKALRRLLRTIPPAQKGKASQGDCLIVESSLRLAASLRDAGHSGPVVFLSSNVHDYCTAGSGGRLAPPLDVEFPDARLGYACRWAATGLLARP